MTTQVHQRSNEDGVVLHGVNHSRGETARAATAMMRCHTGPSFRLQKNPLHGELNFVKELDPQTGDGLFIVANRLGQIRLRG